MMRVAIPAILNESATFARASSATYWDYNRVLQTVGSNVLRFNWDRETAVFQGVLIEPASTNLVLNNASMSTQTRSVSNGATYTFSFYGTGSVTLSGAAAGTMTGTGSTVRQTRTFVASSGSLTMTCSGTVQHGQLELGTYASSVIVTAGSTVTRAADVVTGTGPFYNPFVDSTPTYNAGTTYALADVIKYGGRLYESLQASNTGNTPDASPLWWLDTGPDNTHALFDYKVGTRSVTSNAADFVAILAPTHVDTVAAMNLADTFSIHFVVGNGRTVSASLYKDAWPDNAAFVGVSPGQCITLVISNVDPDLGGPPDPLLGNPQIGELVIGVSHEIGEAQFGMGMSLIDFSRKDTDEFGAVIFVERPYSKRLSCSVTVEKDNFNDVLDLLLSVRATPVVWDATGMDEYASASRILGFLRDLRLSINTPTVSTFNLEIESLT